MYPEPFKVLMQHFDKIHHMKLSECPNFNLNWSLTWTVLMSVQDKGKRSHLSCQMTARRASGQSEARVVLLGTGRSGDWTTWRATARQQRVKMNSCSATGNTHFHTFTHKVIFSPHLAHCVFMVFHLKAQRMRILERQVQMMMRRKMKMRAATWAA